MTPRSDRTVPTIGTHTDGTFDVQCWCQATVVRVPRAYLLIGRTKSCGRAGCQRPRE